MTMESLILKFAEVVKVDSMSLLGKLSDVECVANVVSLFGYNNYSKREVMIEKVLKSKKYSNCSSLCEALLSVNEYMLCLFVSLYVYDVPIQVSKPFDIVMCLVKTWGCNPNVDVNLKVDVDCEDDRSIFPLKMHPGSATKVNLFFRDVWKDCKMFFPHVAEFVRHYSFVFGGMANDEATAWLMWIVAVFKLLDLATIVVIVSYARDIKTLKTLSDIVKSLGIGDDKRMACMAELVCLRGRSVDSVDFVKERAHRLSLEEFDKVSNCFIDENKLRIAIREIYELEIDVRVGEYDDIDSFWARRWAWTKSGSHSHMVEKMVMGRVVTGSQATRREFVENVKENIVAKTEPVVLLGESEKLETGKTRALFAGDTISYINFEYVLKDIETRWLGFDVILAPGDGWQIQQYDKWSSMGTYGLMFDYSDFNSQHSVTAMRMVFEELAAHFSGDKLVLDWCVESFNNMKLKVGDEMLDWVATLPSGHRATTFINSVLNKAYVKVVLGEVYNRLTWKHVGDDVLACCNDTDVVDMVVGRIVGSKLRMNRSKQGCGRFSKEFLRVSFNNEGGVGYIARSIASGVAGNWVSEFKLNRSEYIESMLERNWTMRMRSGSDVSLLNYSSLVRRVPELSTFARELCLCYSSLNGSPVIWKGNRWEKVVISMGRVRRERRNELLGFATQDYIENFSDVGKMATLGLEVGDLRNLMLEVSERVVEIIDEGEIDLVVGECVAKGHVHMMGRPNKVQKDGLLSSDVTLSFMKQSIDVETVREMLALLGYGAVGDVMAYAWGDRRCSVAAASEMPYSCANVMGRATNESLVFTTQYPLAV